jgi:hypothetical protein
MRLARRAIAVLTVFATGFIAAATAASAMIPDPPGVNVAPSPTAVPPTPPTGLSAWQFVAFVGLGVLMSVAIVGLGYALSHSRKSRTSPRSQHPLPS